MAFDLGKKRKVRPEVNVTPLVDVVLVLLIIFMVITPLMNKHFWVHIPKEEKPEKVAAQASKDEPPLVVTVDRQGRIEMNGQAVPDVEFGPKLLRVFAARSDRVLFFDAMDKVPYGRAVQVMDLARGSGAITIAILTEALVR